MTRSYSQDEITLQRLFVVWAKADTARLSGCPSNSVEVSADLKAIMREHNNAIVRAYKHKTDLSD